MADLSITVNNAINLSASPDNEWGEFNWGEFLWLQGTSDLNTHTFKWITDNAATVTDTLGFAVRMLVTETLTLLSDRSSATLFSGIWAYQTTDGVTDWEDQVLTDWAGDSPPSTTWGSSSAPPTDWS